MKAIGRFTGPSSSGVILGVDGDVLLRQIARPARRLALARAAVQYDAHFRGLQLFSQTVGIELRRLPVAKYGHSLKRKSAPIGVKSHPRIARRRDDPAPVR